MLLAAYEDQSRKSIPRASNPALAQSRSRLFFFFGLITGFGLFDEKVIIMNSINIYIQIYNI